MPIYIFDDNLLYRPMPFYFTEFVDNSGFRFFYTMEKPEIPMAILQIEESTGHIVVPPKSDNFLVAGYCQPECITEVSYVYTVL